MNKIIMLARCCADRDSVAFDDDQLLANDAFRFLSSIGPLGEAPVLPEADRDAFIAEYLERRKAVVRAKHVITVR